MTYHKLFLNISPTRSQNISSNFTNKISEYFANKISEYYTSNIYLNIPPNFTNPTFAMDKTAYSGKLLQTFTPVTEKNQFENPPNHCPQIMRSCSHSHKTAARKPWCSPYNHQHHQHFTGFWSCTARLQNCYCQTPAQETLPWSWKLTEKLPSNLRTTIYVQNVVLERQNNAYASTNTVTTTSTL